MLGPRLRLRAGGASFLAYARLLGRYLAPDRGRVVALGVSLACGVGLALLGPWLAGRFVDEVKTAASAHDPRLTASLLLPAIGYPLAGIAEQALLAVSGQLGAQLGWRATNRLRGDALGRCLSLDLSFHQRHGPGVMVERVDGDVRELSNFFTDFSLSLAVNLLLIVGVLGVILAVDLRVGLAFVAFSAAALAVFSRVRGTASPYWAGSRQASAALYGDAEERFGGLPDIRANGAAGYVERRFAARLGEEFRRTRTASTVGMATTQASGLVLKLGGVAILGVAALLFQHGRLPLGTVVAVSLYARLISTPLSRILDQINDLPRAAASIARVRELLELEPSVRPGPGAELPPGPLAVELEHVTFAYPTHGGGAPCALADVSFRLEPGEVLGVVGRTGAGKSTLVRLLLRLYDPTGGRVTLGGVDLRRLTNEQLRAHVRVVTQEVQLFHTTLRDNLTLFDEGVDDAVLVAALEEVGLGAWYARRPLGLDTVIASGGGGLSAGEAQLVGLVRVFLADPAVVILDEPTSRLHPQTEARLEAAFDRLLASRTAIVVAHRPSTLRGVDKVLVLDGGRVVA